MTWSAKWWNPIKEGDFRICRLTNPTPREGRSLISAKVLPPPLWGGREYLASRPLSNKFITSGPLTGLVRPPPYLWGGIVLNIFDIPPHKYGGEDLCVVRANSPGALVEGTREGRA